LQQLGSLHKLAHPIQPSKLAVISESLPVYFKL